MELLHNIKIEGLTKKYGKNCILNNNCFFAASNDIIAIAGANGSGKSTFLSILSGHLKPNCGSVFYDNINMLKNKKLFASYVGYVPQSNPLIEDLTVKDNLRLWYSRGPLNLNQELKSGVLNYLDLNKVLKYKVSKLSGGMKKRLSIAVATAFAPPILVLDEPSNDLDLMCQKNIHSYLKAYAQSGRIVIMSTHNENDISICNTLYTLNHSILTRQPDIYTGEALLKLITP